jgi:hypothetical protein
VSAATLPTSQRSLIQIFATICCADFSYKKAVKPHLLFSSFSQKIDGPLPKVCDVEEAFSFLIGILFSGTQIPPC